MIESTWSFEGYELVVGLEVHVELATATKFRHSARFCGTSS